MIVISNNQVYSDSGKYIRRLGSDSYFKKCTVLSGESEANFEEVDELPDSELNQVKEAKIAEIDAYDKSKNVNWFYVNGVGMWYDAPKRTTIRNLVESQIKEGRESTTLWTEEEPIIPIEVSCDMALVLLAKLEVYAGDCKANTQQHKAAVYALTSKEEIEAYDYTTGYPEKLNLSTEL